MSKGKLTGKGADSTATSGFEATTRRPGELIDVLATGGKVEVGIQKETQIPLHPSSFMLQAFP